MKLLELFDKPIVTKWEAKDPGYWKTSFKIGETTYTIDAGGSNHISINFDADGEQGITGKGNEIAVFSAVCKAIIELIKTRKPKEFSFQALKNQPSRVKLYDRLSTRLASQTGYKLEVDELLMSVRYNFTK